MGRRDRARPDHVGALTGFLLVRVMRGQSATSDAKAGQGSSFPPVIKFLRRELREIHGYSAMRRTWDIDLIFPIKDTASAALMVIKADCLHNAGVISDGERQWIHSRARPFLSNGTFKDAA
jgi:hypothetical protein